MKTLRNIVLVGTLMLSTAVQASNTKLTNLFTDEQKAIVRVETIENNLPLNSEAYFLNEGNEGSQLYKLRLQSVRSIYKNIILGLVVQHVDGTGFSARQESGFMLRYINKTNDELFKTDFRYFEESNMWDAFIIFKQSQILYDVLATYNEKTDKLMIRPGINYKNLRLEMKFLDSDECYKGIGWSKGF